jgi:hypothetical protein
VVIPLEIPVPRELDLVHLRKWVRQRLPATEEQRSQLLAAIGAWQRLHRGRAKRGDLQLVVDAAMSQYSAIWCTGAELLGRLISAAPGAKEAFEQAVKRGNAAQRWHLNTGLYDCLDRDFSREMLRQSLHDKSAAVRERASEKIQQLAFVELVGDMLEREKIETRPRTLEMIQHNRLLLSQGWYALTHQGQMRMIIRCSDGGISSKRVTSDELEHQTLDEIAHDRQMALI